MRWWHAGGALALAGAVGCPGSIDTVGTTHGSGSGGSAGTGGGNATGTAGTGGGTTTCTDGKQGGDETDVDCGGSCPPCALGQACAKPGDCGSGACAGGICAAPAPWSKRFGDGATQYGNGVTADALDDVLVIGNFGGTVDFGGGALTSASSVDVFVAKYDPTGKHLWSKRLGGASGQSGNGIATDGAGNVLVTGIFDGSVDFGGGALTGAGGADIFVAKYDPTGKHLWSKRFGDADQQLSYCVAADGQGNVLMTGNFSGAVDFGGGVLTGGADAFSPDIFVAKYDPTGKHLWSKRFGDAGSQTGTGVAADAQGNVLVTGDFAGSVDFGGGVLTSAGGADVFIAKYDPTGKHLWSKRFGDADHQGGTGVAVDGLGNVLVTGSLAGAADFGGGALTSAGSVDLFVAKLDPTGKHLWSKRFGDASDQYGFGIAVDAAGNALVTGAFSGAVDLGGGALTSAGIADILVASYDPAGNHLWSKRFGDASNQRGNAVAAGGAGSVLVTGSLRGTADFGDGALTSAGGEDAFLAKLVP
jgi:hypothetical protein